MWTVLTWFKNKSATFYTFQNFYNKYWGITDFIYCIGYTNDENKNFILNNYFGGIEFDKTNIGNSKLSLELMHNIEILNGTNNIYNFQIILYKTNNKTNVNDWNNIKNVFSNILLNNFNPQIKLLVVDDEEVFLLLT